MILDTIRNSFTYKYKDAFEETKTISHEEFEKLINSKVAEKLSVTKREFEDYLTFKEMTPFQKVLSFVDSRAKIVETMLAATVYYKQESEKPGFDAHEKSFFKARLQKKLETIYTMENISAGQFFGVIVDLYGFYFTSRNLSKEEVIYRLIQKTPPSPLEVASAAIDEDIKKLEADMFPKERKHKHFKRDKK